MVFLRSAGAFESEENHMSTCPMFSFYRWGNKDLERLNVPFYWQRWANLGPPDSQGNAFSSLPPCGSCLLTWAFKKYNSFPPISTLDTVAPVSSITCVTPSKAHHYFLLFPRCSPSIQKHISLCINREEKVFHGESLGEQTVFLQPSRTQWRAQSPSPGFSDHPTPRALLGVSSARPRRCTHWCSCREWQLCLGAIAELEESTPSSWGLAFPDSELKLTMYLPLSPGSCEVLLPHPQRGRKIKERQNFSISPRCALGTKKASEPLQKNRSKQSRREWPGLGTAAMTESSCSKVRLVWIPCSSFAQGTAESWSMNLQLLDRV